MIIEIIQTVAVCLIAMSLMFREFWDPLSYLTRDKLGNISRSLDIIAKKEMYAQEKVVSDKLGTARKSIEKKIKKDLKNGK